MYYLIRKALFEARLLLICSTVIIFVFTWIHVLVVASLDTGSLETFLDQFDWFEKFLPVSFSELVTHSGRVAIAYDHPIVMISVLGFAISRGSDCISGEIGRGSMEMLLAQPVSRVQIIHANVLVTTIGIAILAIASWLGTTCGIHTTEISVPDPESTITIPFIEFEIPNPWARDKKMQIPLAERVQAEHILPAAINLFSLGFCFAGMSLLMSSFDRYRWRTIGLVIGLFIIQVLIKISAMALKSSWVMCGTLLAGYEPQRYVKFAANGTDPWAWSLQENGQWVLGTFGGNAVLLGLGAGAITLATMIFVKRDVPAPL